LLNNIFDEYVGLQQDFRSVLHFTDLRAIKSVHSVSGRTTARKGAVADQRLHAKSRLIQITQNFEGRLDIAGDLGHHEDTSVAGAFLHPFGYVPFVVRQLEGPSGSSQPETLTDG